MDNELISASISDRGLSEKRPHNEDSFVELAQFGVFAVADGVGGANAGDFASQMAMEVLTEVVANRRESEDAEELFQTAITHANRSIHQTALELPQLSSMATTIVALHLKGNIATIAHVGDSRIYRVTPDGRIFRETNDHSVVEEEVRAGRMTPEEALIHPSRNIISRALGAEENVEIDIKTIMVEPNTTFLLCSDGITRHIGDAELQTLLAGAAEPRLICEQLKELCYSRGAEDNLTAVIVRTFAEGVEKIDDFDSTMPVLEDETVATARTAFPADDSEKPADDNGFVHDTISQIDPEEFETGDLPAPAPVSEAEETPAESAIPASEQEPQFVEPLSEPSTDEQFLMTEGESEPEQPESETVDSPSAPEARSRQDYPDPEFTMFGRSLDGTYEATGPSKRGAGRILLSLGLLVLGGAIAVGASYYLGFTGPQEVPAPPQVETMKTQDIPLTLFEETRRTVDSDPATYLQRAPTSNDAADFYLRGRALLLTGKAAESKIQLEQARERLPQVDDKERKTLANEIALALAVVENDQMLERFRRSLESNGPVANSNSNSSIR